MNELLYACKSDIYPPPNRNIRLDILRIIACLMVILMHSPSTYTNLDGVSYHCLDMLAEPCVGLFFMVSGSLLLPVRLSYFDFIKKRVCKVLWPALIFLVLKYVIAICLDEISWNDFIKSICSMPFTPDKIEEFWFIYPLIGMYLLAPVISPFLEKASKGELQILLIFWLITLCYKPLQLVLNVNTTEENMLHSFTGYTGYFLLGFYLTKFPIKRNLIIIIPLLLLIPWCMDAANKLLDWGVSKYDYFWYLSVFCVMQCIAWFTLICVCIPIATLSDKTVEVIISLSTCSFGIYLMHRIIMQRVVWNISFLYNLHPYLQIIVIFTLTLLLSWAVVWLISKLPFSKYIVGVKSV